MNDIMAIQQRISRRSFLDNKVSEEKINRMREKIQEIQAQTNLDFQVVPDGSSAFSELSKSYGMFSNARSLLVIRGAKDPIALEQAGYYGEKLVLELTKLELGSCWVCGTYDRSNPLLQAKDDKELIAVIPFGGVTQQISTKEKMIRGLSHRRTKTAKDMTNASVGAPDWFWEAMEAVALAPSALNSQKTQIMLKEGKIIARINGKKETDFIDLGIAKLHFEIGSQKSSRFRLGDGGELI